MQIPDAIRSLPLRTQAARAQMAYVVVPTLALASVGLDLATPLAAFAPWQALGAGIVTRTILGAPSYQHRVGPLAGHIQTGALIGLGAATNLDGVLKTGLQGIGYTAGSVFLTLQLGKYLAKRFPLDEVQGKLIDAGTAICGISAVNAAVKALKLDINDPRVAMAVGTVSVLNGVALIAFPLIGHLFHMTPHAFGLWAALSMHDTNSVLGAAGVYEPGSEALHIATLVKAVRALWIVPLVLLGGFGTPPQDLPKHPPKIEVRRKSMIPEIDMSKVSIKKIVKTIPPFVLGFALAAALTNGLTHFFPELGFLGDMGLSVSKRAMVLTLLLVGTKISIPDLLKVGARPFFHGLGLWVMAGGLSLAAVQAAELLGK